MQGPLAAPTTTLLSTCVVTLAAACSSDRTPSDAAVPSDAAQDAAPAYAAMQDAATQDADAAAAACAPQRIEQRIDASEGDTVDVLFVIDDTASMVEEQGAMRTKLSAMMQRLVTGRRSDGTRTRVPRDLRVGVISADLGSGGLASSAPGCGEDSGDGAVLQHVPHGEGCAESYPAFLETRTQVPTIHPWLEPSAPSAVPTATDFACIGTLGTQGCDFSQPLEAAFAALWPAVDEAGERIGTSSFEFPDGVAPRGAAENAGFLRSDPERSPSLLVVVVISDEDDCSVLSPDLYAQPIGVSGTAATCAGHPQALLQVERYVKGLNDLRHEGGPAVAFAAITGIPPELTTPEARKDARSEESRVREAYYDAVLAHPLMQPTIDQPGTLRPACDSATAKAVPGRRLVEVARRFATRGTVHSICDDDWSQVFDDVLADLSAPSKQGACLPHAMPRDEAGYVDCTVTWELPPEDRAREGIPTRCTEVAGLEPDPERSASASSGAVCRMKQLGVLGTFDAPELEPGAGWFYDDFSQAARASCDDGSPHTIFLAPTQPPAGVSVSVTCTVRAYAFPGQDELAPSSRPSRVFEDCDPEEPHACERALADPAGGLRKDGIDRALYCHPERAQCVPECSADGCPAGWRCNDESPAWCEPIDCPAP